MHEHGPLPTSYLTAFSTLKSDKRAIERLGHLFHETRLVDQPKQQFDTLDARYNQLVYDITSDAEILLKEEQRYSDFAPQPYGHWKHKCMVSCITASVEIASLRDPNVEYIPQHQILERSNARSCDRVTLRFSVEVANANTGHKETTVVVPDALFALRYLSDAGPLYRLFFVEADRATEPSRSYRFNRKSWMRTAAQYRALIGKGLYRDILHLNASAMLLCVTTNTTHMHNIMEVVKEGTSTGSNTFMLFKALPNFGSYFKPPKPMLELGSKPYSRVGTTSFRIDQI